MRVLFTDTSAARWPIYAQWPCRSWQIGQRFHIAMVCCVGVVALVVPVALVAQNCIAQSNGNGTGRTGASAISKPVAAQKSSTDKYRVLTAKDKIHCGAYMASMVYSYGKAPVSGELTGFECLDKKGKTRSIALKSKKMVNGKIVTRDFGTILMKTGNYDSATYSMRESQIKKLKAYLGF